MFGVVQSSVHICHLFVLRSVVLIGLPVHEAHQFFRTHSHLCSLPDMGLDKCLDGRLDMLRQARPSRDDFSQI